MLMTLLRIYLGIFLVGWWLRFHLPLHREGVGSLFRDLRSRMLLGQKNQKPQHKPETIL